MLSHPAYFSSSYGDADPLLSSKNSKPGKLLSELGMLAFAVTGRWRLGVCTRIMESTVDEKAENQVPGDRLYTLEAAVRGVLGACDRLASLQAMCMFAWTDKTWKPVKFCGAHVWYE